MKILLTGYKGFIGSHLLERFLHKQYNVSVFEWGDILPPVDNFDWVVHVGAISSTTEKNVEKIMKQNVDFTIMLYESCKLFNVNFQFASSAAVYGLGKDFNEESPVDPRTPYAWSKYFCERYMLNNPGNIVTHIFRYFNVYGPEGEEHKGSQASPFRQFKDQFTNTGTVSVFENSENSKRDFIHVSDVVETHMNFLKVTESGVWNVGTGSTKSFLDIAHIYSDKIKVIPMPDELKLSYQWYTCADTTKLKKTLTNLQ